MYNKISNLDFDQFLPGLMQLLRVQDWADLSTMYGKMEISSPEK
jgi:hypothetical protein